MTSPEHLSTLTEGISFVYEENTVVIYGRRPMFVVPRDVFCFCFTAPPSCSNFNPSLSRLPSSTCSGGREGNAKSHARRCVALIFLHLGIFFFSLFDPNNIGVLPAYGVKPSVYLLFSSETRVTWCVPYHRSSPLHENFSWLIPTCHPKEAFLFESRVLGGIRTPE